MRKYYGNCQAMGNCISFPQTEISLLHLSLGGGRAKMPVSPPLAAGGEICEASDPVLALLTITGLLQTATLPSAHTCRLYCLYSAHPPTLYAPSLPRTGVPLHPSFFPWVPDRVATQPQLSTTPPIPAFEYTPLHIITQTSLVSILHTAKNLSPRTYTPCPQPPRCPVAPF